MSRKPSGPPARAEGTESATGTAALAETRLRPLPRSFHARPALELAPDLLNKVLVSGRRAGRIVEVEAYGGASDPGSHGHRGMTPRNRTMFGPPGRLYVYLTYGMYHCANVVCGADGICAAVLLRAVAPMRGEPLMHRARETLSRRKSTRPFKPTDLCSGPARLCQAFELDLRHDGRDLAAGRTCHRPGDAAPDDPEADPVESHTGARTLFIADDGVAPPAEPTRTGRIGVTSAPNRLWRFHVPGDPNVSR